MNILVAGDFVPQNRLVTLLDKNDFASVFGEVKDTISSVDYAIVNFECPVGCDSFNPIKKCGPNLKCNRNAVEAVKWAGFDCCTLANNHILDYGADGLRETVKCCTDAGLETVGVGDNMYEASKILYKEINGQILAVINCCEHEFSIATEIKAGANPLNPVQQFYAIREARQKADIVLVVVHGGHEYHQLPSPRMVSLYRYFVDCGADAVVNHHQHCYSGFEEYNGKPIFYGLGNLCFDSISKKVHEIWNYGYMVKMCFEGGCVSCEIVPYEQCGLTPSVELLDKTYFDEKLKELNAIIADEKQLQIYTDEYFKSSMNGVAAVLNPTKNKYIAAAQNRGFLPSPLDDKWLLKLQDYVLCESHRDKVDFFLKNR